MRLRLILVYGRSIRIGDAPFINTFVNNQPLADAYLFLLSPYCFARHTRSSLHNRISHLKSHRQYSTLTLSEHQPSLSPAKPSRILVVERHKCLLAGFLVVSADYNRLAFILNNFESHPENALSIIYFVWTLRRIIEALALNAS